jgi:hypothetical protein
VGAPIGHRVEHMLSGVPAALAIKVDGEDLSELRRLATEVEEALEGSPGLTDLAAEQQVLSPELKTATNELKRKISDILLRSPHFGGAIVIDSIQKKMDRQDGITVFFANMLYGSHSLEWSSVRRTKSGQVAETYIREQILKPKFMGIRLTAAEDSLRRRKAEELVKSAVQGN